MMKVKRDRPLWGLIWYRGYGVILGLGRVSYEWGVKK